MSSLIRHDKLVLRQCNSPSRLKHPFHCYTVPQVIHHLPRCSHADKCQLAARLPLAIYNPWQSSHLHCMHTISMKHHHIIIKISNLFYTGKHNFPTMSLFAHNCLALATVDINLPYGHTSLPYPRPFHLQFSPFHAVKQIASIS
jgi:hypothetical protein